MNSGRHLLGVSFSGFDPEQKSATSKVSSDDRSLKVGGRHRVAVIVATVLERVRRPARLASVKVVEKDAAKDGWAEGPPLFSFTGTEGGVVYG